MSSHTKLIKRLLSFFILVTFLFTPLTHASFTLPTPTNAKYLNDYTGMINQNATSQIISIGYELEVKTGAQAIVAVVDSTNGLPIEDYALRLFRGWGIGQKEKDNGLLVLLAIGDGAWRVEVGRGLEGGVPDALTHRIMNELAKPSFIEGNYSTGLLQAYSSLCDAIANEYDVTLDKSLNIPLPNTGGIVSTSRNPNLIYGIFIGLLALDLVLNRGRVSSTLLQLIFLSNIGRRGGPPRGGGSSGGFGGFGGGSSNGGGSSGRW